MAEDEIKINRVSMFCAATAYPLHSSELCDDDAGLRRYLFGWECECECHEREETK